MALIAGVILTIIASLLFPGGPLIDSVDQGDFPASIAVMSDSGTITHVPTLALIIGTLLEGYALLAFFRLLGRKGSLADSALRFGLVASLFGWGVFIVGMGMRHMVVHVTQHGVGAGASPDLDGLALTIYTAMAGMHFAFLAVYPFAAMLFGLGLAPRFQTMNAFKLASYGMVLVGAVGLINIVLVQHIHDVDVGLFALISNSFLMLGAVFFLILGVGMYQGRSEFTGEDSSG